MFSDNMIKKAKGYLIFAIVSLLLFPFLILGRLLPDKNASSQRMSGIYYTPEKYPLHRQADDYRVLEKKPPL